MNKYLIEYRGITFDVYRMLDIFKINHPARQHAIKKLLFAGNRGHKGRAQDLREAIVAIERELVMMSEDDYEETC